MNNVDISRLSDDELLDRAQALARSERAVTCDLVEHLAEIDKRGLPERRAGMSLFEFCVYQLRLSEEAAYRRIRAARAVRKLPAILLLLRDGKLTLETVALLHPFLGDDDAAALVKSCVGLRKWQVQALLAGRETEKPRRDVIRYCGPIAVETVSPKDSDDATLFKAAVANVPITPAPVHIDRQPSKADPSARTPPSRPPGVRVSFSADQDFYKLLMRARALLRHKYPDGRLEGILRDALVALLRRKDSSFGWNNG